jgi:AraC-like DNA-binding protein
MGRRLAMKADRNGKAGRVELEMRRVELARQVTARISADGVWPTGIERLSYYRRSEPSPCVSAAYEPTLILFLQGRKQINLGSEGLMCDGRNFLLTSVDLPVVSQVVEASLAKPMLGMILQLKMTLVREILGQQESVPREQSTGARGMAVGETTVELLDAFQRLAAMYERPEPYLANLIEREIIYRILSGPQGRHLRAIATLGEQSNRTAKAVEWLKANFAKPLRIEQLAALSHMGVSTFHHHFRTLTQMSPLQYQKQLRLHVARERMLTEGLDAASAAFEVGYESPSQFSREYARFFGAPPLRDVRALRSSPAAAMSD